jgi:hypothetical protein
LENKILGWTALRDSIAADMRSMLNGAAFNDEVFDEVTARQLISHAQALLEDVNICAANPVSCAQ